MAPPTGTRTVRGRNSKASAWVVGSKAPAITSITGLPITGVAWLAPVPGGGTAGAPGGGTDGGAPGAAGGGATGTPGGGGTTGGAGGTGGGPGTCARGAAGGLCALVGRLPTRPWTARALASATVASAVLGP